MWSLYIIIILIRKSLSCKILQLKKLLLQVRQIWFDCLCEAQRDQRLLHVSSICSGHERKHPARCSWPWKKNSDLYWGIKKQVHINATLAPQLQHVCTTVFPAHLNNQQPSIPYKPPSPSPPQLYQHLSGSHGKEDAPLGIRRRWRRRTAMAGERCSSRPTNHPTRTSATNSCQSSLEWQ